MTRPQAEKLAKHAGRVVVAFSAMGNVGVAIFFALGFGFTTPQRMFAELHRADSMVVDSVRAVRQDLGVEKLVRDANEMETRRMIHATLMIECLTAKPAILQRVNVECQAVLAEGAIK